MCNNNVITRPIDELLRQTGGPLFDANDATLIGGWVAIARIVSVLWADWGRLDGYGQQQCALITALEASTQDIEEDEGA